MRSKQYCRARAPSRAPARSVATRRSYSDVARVAVSERSRRARRHRTRDAPRTAAAMSATARLGGDHVVVLAAEVRLQRVRELAPRVLCDARARVPLALPPARALVAGPAADQMAHPREPPSLARRPPANLARRAGEIRRATGAIGCGPTHQRAFLAVEQRRLWAMMPSRGLRLSPLTRETTSHPCLVRFSASLVRFADVAQGFSL
eukprot:CAMPEP_0185697922 /NCGR_PEP_ID=MMETSP1164-20130828/6035_1 /TAXON_ID=1104430 /ORGANISM="Chrysoreinhardia sp, Strain CCMP2950" /LENGTH=205 /DNA_ID=CAMNT_0028364821 /DNA_START=271 /DNA_END=889 /DNA_ORIENTATION=+